MSFLPKQQKYLPQFYLLNLLLTFLSLAWLFLSADIYGDALYFLCYAKNLTLNNGRKYNKTSSALSFELKMIQGVENGEMNMNQDCK